MQVTVFSALSFEKEFIEKAGSGHQINYISEPLTLENVQSATGSEAVCLFTHDDASAPVLEKLKALGVKYVALRSAGYEHVNLPKAQELGLKVANVPAYSPYAIAEHTVALLLAINRKLILAHEQIKQNNFALDNLVGFDLNGKTVGIIGLGKIGAITAKILQGFGCRILFYDIAPAPASFTIPASLVSLTELLSQSDIVSLHAPLTEATKYLINAQTLSFMKKGAILLNTSRGGLINTEALVAALKIGQINAAGLDVYEKERALFFHERSAEPLTDKVFAELISLPNVLVTGHQAFLTRTALHNIAETTFYNLNTWANGQDSENELAFKETHKNEKEATIVA
ncbi:2-hydroxyacid dehydrogenase [Adhaeribacter aquaticus]|uniref:2-hydroxyacid dehydrogenase n=1 Tax=Adhaeribacter aquaticus TaxID=299567 RepID=UPI00040107C4|nr:2-hydroxyacid dehydrogenase [Adhaeribacter aquaticus]